MDNFMTSNGWSPCKWLSLSVKLWSMSFTIRKNLPVQILPYLLQYSLCLSHPDWKCFKNTSFSFLSLLYDKLLNVKFNYNLATAFPEIYHGPFLYWYPSVGRKRHTAVSFYLTSWKPVSPLTRVAFEATEHILFTFIYVLLFTCSKKAEVWNMPKSPAAFTKIRKTCVFISVCE